MEDHVAIATLHEKTGLLSLNQLYTQAILTESWKILNTPGHVLGTMLEQIPKISIKTKAQSRGDLVVYGKSKLARINFRYQAARLWNTAPRELRTAGTINEAKRKIREFVTLVPI